MSLSIQAGISRAGLRETVFPIQHIQPGKLQQNAYVVMYTGSSITTGEGIARLYRNPTLHSKDRAA